MQRVTGLLQGLGASAPGFEVELFSRGLAASEHRNTQRVVGHI